MPEHPYCYSTPPGLNKTTARTPQLPLLVVSPTESRPPPQDALSNFTAGTALHPRMTVGNTTRSTISAYSCDGSFYWGYGHYTKAGQGDYWALIDWNNYKTLVYLPTMPDLSYLHATNNVTWYRYRVQNKELFQLFGGGSQQGAGEIIIWINIDLHTAGAQARATPGGILEVRCDGHWMGSTSVEWVGGTWSPFTFEYQAQLSGQRSASINAIKQWNLALSCKTITEIDDQSMNAVQALRKTWNLLRALYPEMHPHALTAALNGVKFLLTANALDLDSPVIQVLCIEREKLNAGVDPGLFDAAAVSVGTLVDGCTGQHPSSKVPYGWPDHTFDHSHLAGHDEGGSGD